MKTHVLMVSRIIQRPSAALTCELYGEGKLGLVIEMGLGAVMAEWRRLAQQLSQRHTVLLYQRAGYGGSGVSALERTPRNIALELHQLLEHIPHEEKVILLGHSQGGLYAWNFAQVYPELVRALILLDPLSPEEAMIIETLWQEIMGAYLSCAQRGELVRAGHSSHYIHLTDPELICRVVEELDNL